MIVQTILITHHTHTHTFRCASTVYSSIADRLHSDRTCRSHSRQTIRIDTNGVSAAPQLPLCAFPSCVAWSPCCCCCCCLTPTKKTPHTHTHSDSFSHTHAHTHNRQLLALPCQLCWIRRWARKCLAFSVPVLQERRGDVSHPIHNHANHRRSAAPLSIHTLSHSHDALSHSHMTQSSLLMRVSVCNLLETLVLSWFLYERRLLCVILPLLVSVASGRICAALARVTDNSPSSSLSWIPIRSTMNNGITRVRLTH